MIVSDSTRPLTSSTITTSAALSNCYPVSQPFLNVTFYYALFHGYYSWDKLNYAEAFRYLQHADDLTEGVSRNRDFLQNLLELEAKGENGFSERSSADSDRRSTCTSLWIFSTTPGARLKESGMTTPLQGCTGWLNFSLRSCCSAGTSMILKGRSISPSCVRFFTIKGMSPCMHAEQTGRELSGSGLRSKFMLLEDLGMKGAGEYYMHLEPSYGSGMTPFSPTGSHLYMAMKHARCGVRYSR